ncbi:hypothetical protein CK203_090475 [Vitis vinifera]|uniref:Uncharacterized protein n=1 Tax=Vitis vinifera TaxID=29760 RepID=A0A438BTT6_VITVI|nr:hypothetical protein CK203_090475 [Vitis vinifera]
MVWCSNGWFYQAFMGISATCIYSSSRFLFPNRHQNGFPEMGRVGRRRNRNIGRSTQLFRAFPGGAAEEGGDVDKRFRWGGRRRDVQYRNVSEGYTVHAKFGNIGGSQLNVPRGRWVTGSFNLTSNFTLFLEEGAVILVPRMLFVLVITVMVFLECSDHNAVVIESVEPVDRMETIDGQGKMWWELWWNRTLEHTRGHLLEIKNSHNILISNLTFMNSPF